MTTMADVQRASFEDRLNRIHKGGPNTMGEILVGAADDSVRSKKKRKTSKVKRKAQPKEIGISPMADIIFMPMAVLFGLIAMQAGRIGAFHLFTEAGAYPLITDNYYVNLGGDAGLALVVATIFAIFFRMAATGPRRFGLLLGMVAMYFGEPYLMGFFPDIYAVVYPTPFVAETLIDPPIQIPTS